MLLVGLVYCWSITQVIVAPKELSSSLDQAGAYSTGADVLKQSFVSSLTAANVAEPTARSVIEASVSATAVATSAQPALRSFSSWLKSQDQAPLILSLDLTGIKSQIARQAKLSGSSEVSFVATREIQDELTLVGEDAQQNITGIKTGYQRAVELIPVLAMSIAIGLGLLVLLALRQPSKRLSWPAWTMIIAGAAVLLLMFVLPLIPQYTLPKGGQGQDEQVGVIAVGLVRGLAQGAKLYAYLLLGLGSALLAFSLVVKRNHAKKNKKKH